MSDCILWTGVVNWKGYGVVHVGQTTTTAHRAAWIAAHGPVPDRLFIDHLCRNRLCVNIDHLEAVTPSENLRRAPRYQVTECPQGHPLSGENLYLQGTWRSCRICRGEASRRNESVKSFTLSPHTHTYPESG